MDLIKLSNGVQVVEYTREESDEYEDLEAAIEHQFSVRVSIQNEIEVGGGRCRVPVIGDVGRAIEWNQAKRGNVRVTDGSDVGNWATFPATVTAREALDAYLATADYSGATSRVTVTAEILSGEYAGDVATMVVQ